MGFDSNHSTNGTTKEPITTRTNKLPRTEMHMTMIPAMNNLSRDILLNFCSYVVEVSFLNL